MSSLYSLYLKYPGIIVIIIILVEAVIVYLKYARSSVETWLLYGKLYAKKTLQIFDNTENNNNSNIWQQILITTV